MNDKKTMKRALLSSVIAMFLCIAMLIGTTFAWFTDSATSGVNKIQAGNLDVEVYHSSASVTTNTTIESETKLFRDVNGDAMLWEPGAMSYETFTVKNEGSLALKYKLAMNILDYNAVSGTANTLKDVLKVKVLTGREILSNVTRNTVQSLDWDVSDTLDVFNTSGDLLAGESDVFQVIVYWAPGAGDNNFNVNNGKVTTDGQPLFIDFGINVVASQLSYENDSFGPDYDQGIVLPDLPVSINKVFQSAPITGESVAESVTVKNVSTDAGVATVQADSVNAVISALKDLATDKAEDSDLSTVIYLDVQTADKAETSVTYEIDMYATLTYKDTNGTSQTKTLSSLNGKLADNIVTATMDIGKGLSNVTVKHHDTPMTQLSSETTEEEGYYYNKTTGVLTIKSKSFSPFTVDYTIDAVAAIGNNVYTTLDEAIAAAQSGDTVVLLKNITLASDLQLGGNGKSLTLHLNKYTIDGGEHQVYTDGVGTISICGGGTIKNANTTKNADYAPLRIYQYSSVVLDDVTINGIYCAVKNSGNLTVKKANITGTTFGLGCFLDGTTVIGQLDGNISDIVVTAQEQALATAAATGYATMNVTVYSGTFTSSGTVWDDCPVYWAGHGTLNVYGGTFKNETSDTGAAGLLQKNGTVNVYGGTFNAKDGIKLVAQGDSTEIITKIEGGAFAGTRSGIYIDASDGTYMGQLSQYIVSIANGNSVPTFMGGTVGAIYAKTGGLGSRSLMTITGGSYSTKPNSEYLATGYKATLKGAYYVVSPCTDHIYEDGICKECGKVQETWLAIENAMTVVPEGYSVDGNDVTISSNYGLAWFAKQVNAGNNFASYTVKLNADIDLLDYPWTPINGFTGIFDGGEKTISNLYFKSTTTYGQGFGLFGQSNGQLKNLTIHNAYVMGNAACGAFVGQGNGLLENLHLTGKITIGTTTDQGHLANFNSSYIGGIRGNSFRGKIKNCTVTGEEGSIICGGRQVGGILGFDSYGYSDSVVGCTVTNMHIFGAKSIGGIVGWANSTGIQNCTITNVCVELVDASEPNTIGLISGTSRCLINDTETTVYENNTVDTASKLIVNGETPSFDSHPVLRLYSPYSSETYVTLGDGKYMFTCYGITKAMTKGDHITLLDSSSEQVTIPEGRTITIDLNGYTLLGQFGTPVITNNGTLVIKNGTIAGEVSGENITTENITVTEPICVATIGEKKYSILQTAIENAEVNDTIQLQQNVVETVEVSAGQTLTIDLNGFKLSGTTNYTIDNYGVLTLQDTKGGGEVVGTSYSVWNNSEGTLNVKDGVTIRSTVGAAGYYGLAVYNEGTLNISGGTLLCANDDHWYHNFVYNVGGSVSITGGTFTKDPSKFVDETHQSTQNADGTWTVTAK